MTRQDQAVLLALLALLAADDGDGSQGVLNRVATRATGAVVGMVDINAVLEEVDIDTVLAQVDINELLERVDVDRLLERIDINEVLDEIDIDRLMARVDVKDLAERAGIPDIVRESTGELAGSAIDVLRRQVVALDAVVGTGAYRLTRRDPTERPIAPKELETEVDVGRKGRGQVTGHYAGPLSRLGAFIADVVIVWVVFVLFTAGLAFVADFFIRGDQSRPAKLGLVGFAVLALWAFLYLWVSLTIAGRTVGMGIVGIRVVNREGGTLSPRQALVRTVVFPFSFVIFGLGFLGIFISPERRTMHDAAAGSVVVYDWGDRPAEMPAPLTKWALQHVDEDTLPPAG